MKPRKYNFIPEHQLRENSSDISEYTVNINSNGTLYFSPFTVKMYELSGKIVRFYADVEKKTIAWKEVHGGDLSSIKNVRKLTVVGKSSTIQVVCGKLLKTIGVDMSVLPLKKVPVIKYKGQLDETEYNVIDLRNYAKTKEPNEE